MHGGYTPARRYAVADGERRAFVKVASNRVTARMLRCEARAYGAAQAPFMPRFIGWADDPQTPLLAIEDLSDATWPPPWTTAQIDQALAAIGAMHAMRADLPALTELDPGVADGWTAVARDAAPFLSLGVASQGWLQTALPPPTAGVSKGSPLSGRRGSRKSPWPRMGPRAQNPLSTDRREG